MSLTPKPADAPSAFLWWSHWPRWTRDGKQFLVRGTRPETGGKVQAFVMNVDVSGLTRLTTVPGIDGPAPAEDG